MLRSSLVTRVACIMAIFILYLHSCDGCKEIQYIEKELTQEEINKIINENLSKLTPEQLRLLTKDQLALLTKEQLASLSYAQRIAVLHNALDSKAITPEQLLRFFSLLDEECIKRVFEDLPPDDAKKFIKALTTSQLELISPTLLGHIVPYLTNEDLDNLTNEQLKYIAEFIISAHDMATEKREAELLGNINGYKKLKTEFEKINQADETKNMLSNKFLRAIYTNSTTASTDIYNDPNVIAAIKELITEIRKPKGVPIDMEKIRDGVAEVIKTLKKRNDFLKEIQKAFYTAGALTADAMTLDGHVLTTAAIKALTATMNNADIKNLDHNVIKNGLIEMIKKMNSYNELSTQLGSSSTGVNQLKADNLLALYPIGSPIHNFITELQKNLPAKLAGKSATHYDSAILYAGLVDMIRILNQGYTLPKVMHTVVANDKSILTVINRACKLANATIAGYSFYGSVASGTNCNNGDVLTWNPSIPAATATGDPTNTLKTMISQLALLIHSKDNPVALAARRGKKTLYYDDGAGTLSDINAGLRRDYIVIKLNGHQLKCKLEDGTYDPVSDFIASDYVSALGNLHTIEVVGC